MGLHPPSQSADGSKLYDARLENGVLGFGPFDNVEAFHSFLTNGIKNSPRLLPEISELLRLQEASTSRYGTCFTHGDLSSANILVRGDEIVGIVHWETSGWYPEYWEYTSAWNVNVYNEFWREELSKFIPEYPQALKMEEIRQKYFADF
ncbi:hypothetical protein BJX99DRAFT_216750 [Aspergillus californicus]